MKRYEVRKYHETWQHYVLGKAQPYTVLHSTTNSESAQQLMYDEFILLEETKGYLIDNTQKIVAWCVTDNEEIDEMEFNVSYMPDPEAHEQFDDVIDTELGTIPVFGTEYLHSEVLKAVDNDRYELLFKLWLKQQDLVIL